MKKLNLPGGIEESRPRPTAACGGVSGGASAVEGGSVGAAAQAAGALGGHADGAGGFPAMAGFEQGLDVKPLALGRPAVAAAAQWDGRESEDRGERIAAIPRLGVLFLFHPGA